MKDINDIRKEITEPSDLSGWAFRIRFYIGYYFMPQHYKVILDAYNNNTWSIIEEELERTREIVRCWR